MKTNLTIFALFVTVTLLVVQSSYQEGFSNINGAPVARAGSPHEGNFTCKLSGCHNSYPLGSKIGWITSNIPGSGYVPGQTYTVTATAASSGCTRFGFEISPQTSTGTTAGTAIITNAGQTRFAITGNPRWITHTQTGTSAIATPGTKTWNFDWTAPVSGTGTVTFYGAFNRTNANSSESGDSIFTSTLVVPESTTGLGDAESGFVFSVYPVPAAENLFVELKSRDQMPAEIQLTDITGKIIRNIPGACNCRKYIYFYTTDCAALLVDESITEQDIK